MQPARTIIDGFHSNACSILAITFLIKLDSGLTTMALRGVQCIQFTHMGTQLLHCTGTECVTGCNQHTESIFHQPKTDLKTQYTFQLAKSLLHQKKKEEEKKGCSPTPPQKEKTKRRKTCTHDLHQLVNKTYKQYTSISQISSPSPRSRSVHMICINWPQHSSTNKKQTINNTHQSAKSVLHQPQADLYTLCINQPNQFSISQKQTSTHYTSISQISSPSARSRLQSMTYIQWPVVLHQPEQTCKHNVYQLARTDL